MWLIGTWFSGSLGSAELMVWDNDFKGLFQNIHSRSSLLLLAVKAFRSSTGTSRFQVFKFSARQFLDRSTLRFGSTRNHSSPAPQFPWTLLGSVTQANHKFCTPASQVGDVHRVLIFLWSYQKALCRSSLESMKAERFSLIRVKYPFFLLVWSGSSLEDDFYCVAIIA